MGSAFFPLAVVAGLMIPQIAIAATDNSLQGTESPLVSDSVAVHGSVSIKVENVPRPKKEAGLKADAIKESVGADKRIIERMLENLENTIIPRAQYQNVRADPLDFISQKTGLPVVVVNWYGIGDIVRSAGGFSARSRWSYWSTKDASELLSQNSTSAAKILRHLAAGSNCFLEINPSVVLFVPVLNGDQFPTETIYLPRRFAAVFSEETLESRGVTFLPGAAVVYSASSEKLIVHNSEINRAIIRDLRDDLISSSVNEQRIANEMELDQMDVEQMVKEEFGHRNELANKNAKSAEIKNAIMERVLAGLGMNLSGGFGAMVAPETRINISAENCPMMDLLDRIAGATKTRLIVGGHLVVFVPTNNSKDVLKALE